MTCVPAGKWSKQKQPPRHIHPPVLHQTIYGATPVVVGTTPIMVPQRTETGPGWLSTLLWGSRFGPQEGCSVGSIPHSGVEKMAGWERMSAGWQCKQTYGATSVKWLCLAALHEHKSPCNRETLDFETSSPQTGKVA